MRKGDAESLVSPIEVSHSFVGVSRTSRVCYVKKNDIVGKCQKVVKKEEKDMFVTGLLEKDEEIEGVIEEIGMPPSFQEIIEDIEGKKREIEVGRNIYTCIEQFAQVHTKYKTVDKKVRPTAVPLPYEAKEILRRAKEEPSL